MKLSHGFIKNFDEIHKKKKYKNSAQKGVYNLQKNKIKVYLILLREWFSKKKNKKTIISRQIIFHSIPFHRGKQDEWKFKIGERAGVWNYS